MCNKTVRIRGYKKPNLDTVKGKKIVSDPGSGAFLILGSGMNNLDHISESLKNNFLG
jgi:hypothetical protein